MPKTTSQRRYEPWFKSLEQWPTKDQHLREKYSNTINEDLETGYVAMIKDNQKEKSRSECEWYLPHHPFSHPNKTGKVRRVLNGADKLHGASLNNSLLTRLDSLQNLIYVLLPFRQHPLAVSVEIEGLFLHVGILPSNQPSSSFLWREDSTSNVVVHQYTRHILLQKNCLSALTMH